MTGLPSPIERLRLGIPPSELIRPIAPWNTTEYNKHSSDATPFKALDIFGEAMSAAAREIVVICNDNSKASTTLGRVALNTQDGTYDWFVEVQRSVGTSSACYELVNISFQEVRQ